MTSYLFTPPAVQSLAIRGKTERFPINRIFCVGRNYAAHAREMGKDPDREPPFFFMKPANAIVGNGATIPYPLATKDLHHEIELVVAIGKGGKNIKGALLKASSSSSAFAAAGDGKALIWRAAGNEQSSIATNGFSTAADPLQNANLAFTLVDSATVLETGRNVITGSTPELKGMDEIRRAYELDPTQHAWLRDEAEWSDKTSWSAQIGKAFHARADEITRGVKIGRAHV